MESKARLLDISIDYETHRPRLTFEVETSLADVDKLRGSDLRLTAKKWREKRSLDSNAYFHVLVGKIAESVSSSVTETKNELIMEYGQLDLDADDKPTTIIMRDDIEWKKIDALHLRPTTATKVLDDGKLYRVYLVMRGSHTYDTKEMSRLIDGTVEAAKELGIETATPEELARMAAAWEKKTA